MRTKGSIKSLFEKLPLGVQNKLLEDLHMDQELHGKVLQEASQTVEKSVIRNLARIVIVQRFTNAENKKGNQMYCCNDSEKWYNETTGTPLYNIKLKHKWQA